MKRILPVCLLFFVMLMGGCAHVDSKTVSSDAGGHMEDMLRERVSENWNAAISGDRMKIYALYDPFFRAQISFDSWPGKNTHGKYYSFEIKNMEILGNVAYVTVETEYSFSLIGQLGKKIERERTKAAVNDVWLFVDGMWYRQYKNAMADMSFANY